MRLKMVLIIMLLMSFVLAAQESAVIAGVSLDWERSGDRLIMTMSAETEGWVAVGFDPEKKMRGANILIGYVDEEGSVVLEDHYGHSQFNHRSDLSLGGSRDIELIEGSQENGITRIRFSIPLNSSDEYDGNLVPGRSHKVITAIGRRDSFGLRHSDRGSAELQLIPLD